MDSLDEADFFVIMMMISIKSVNIVQRCFLSTTQSYYILWLLDRRFAACKLLSFLLLFFQCVRISSFYDLQSLLAVFETPSPYMFNWNIPYKVATVTPNTDARAGNRADFGT